MFSLGSRDNNEGTETSALFAGTGCDVTVPSKKDKLNRFDEITERKEREKEEETLEIGDEPSSASTSTSELRKVKRTRKKEKDNLYLEVEEKEVEFDVDAEELERMKELAKRLSRKMEENKQKVFHTNDVDANSRSVDEKSYSESNERRSKSSADAADQATTDLEIKPMEIKSEPPDIEMEGSSEDKYIGNISSAQLINVKKFDKTWKIPSLKKKGSMDSDKEKEKRELVNSAELYSHLCKKDSLHLQYSYIHDDEKKSKCRSSEEDKRKKRKKKRKDASKVLVLIAILKTFFEIIFSSNSPWSDSPLVYFPLSFLSSISTFTKPFSICFTYSAICLLDRPTLRWPLILKEFLYLLHQTLLNATNQSTKNCNFVPVILVVDSFNWGRQYIEW